MITIHDARTKFTVPFYEASKVLTHDFNLNKTKYNELILDSISKNTLSIIDLSLDPWNPRSIKQELQELGFDDKIIFLTGNYDDYTNDKNIIFYPHWLAKSSRVYSPASTSVARKFKVSCLNRNPASHKLYTYYKLYYKKYVNEILLSHSNLDIYKNNTLLTTAAEQYRFIPQHILSEISKINLVKPLDDITWQNDLTTNNLAFTDCYLNLITETSTKVTFFSEKTAKPLASGQLFLSINGENSIKGLQSLGIECYNNALCDHSYDNIPNFISRIDAVIEILDNIYEYIEHLYFDNINAINYNQQYMLSDSFRTKLASPLAALDLIDNSAQ